MLEVITGADGFSDVPIVIVFDTADTPHSVVQVAVYVPAPTSAVVPVAELDQVTVPAQPVAVNIAFSVPHTAVLSDVITGAAGLSEVPMIIVLEATDVPQSEVQVAV